MKIYRIRKKYCNKDKAQIPLPKNLFGIICSKDGILYLNTYGHYISYNDENSFPTYNYEGFANKVFKINQIYVFY